MTESETSKDEWRWVLMFAFVDFTNRILYGMFGTLLGPAQPFLAKNTDVDVATVALLWSYGGVAGLLGAMISAATFKRFVRSSRAKLSFFTIATLLMACFALLFPSTDSFAALSMLHMARSFVATGWETAGAGLLIYTVGPYESRWLVMCHHFVVGLGFWAGPVLMERFIPTRLSGHELCDDIEKILITNGTDIASESVVADFDTEDVLHYPFLMVAIGHLVCAALYVAIMVTPYPMPVYERKNEGRNKSASLPLSSSTKSSLDMLILLSILCFYACSCGSERVFQAMGFLFGLCGHLHLKPKEAIFTDECYNGGFMLGRFLAMFIVDRLAPKRLLQCSITLCLCASLLLALIESWIVLYVCAFVFGMAISWQFGAAFSWAAEHIDVVGPKAASFHVGCALGGSALATLAAFSFKHVSFISVWYIVSGCSIAVVICYLMLNTLFNKLDNGRIKEGDEEGYELIRSQEEE